MKISMISFHTCPLASQEGKETGGMNVYVLELAKALVAKGHTIDVYTRCQDASERIVTVMPGLRVIHLVAGPARSLPKKQLVGYIDEFVHSYCAFVRQEHLDYHLLHCHYYLSGLIGLAIRKQVSRKIPIVLSFHTLALMKNLVARDELEREEGTRIDAEFLLAQQVDIIISPSQADSMYLQYLYDAPPTKLVTIPPGVDLQLFRPIDKHESKQRIGANDEHKIVLFVGRIEPLKGIDLLLYAMKVLVARRPTPEVCLWIVGGDISQHPSQWSKQLQLLEQLRHRLHMSTVVRFIGQQPQSELPYYYNAADVVVMPSHYESFGMAAVEAMSCGVPVITTNVTGVSRRIDEKHKTLVTSVNNPLLLASQIETLLSDGVLHARVSADVRDNVQDLAWSTIADNVIQVYVDVVSRV